MYVICYCLYCRFYPCQTVLGFSFVYIFFIFSGYWDLITVRQKTLKLYIIRCQFISSKKYNIVFFTSVKKCYLNLEEHYFLDIPRFSLFTFSTSHHFLSFPQGLEGVYTPTYLTHSGFIPIWETYFFYSKWEKHFWTQKVNKVSKVWVKNTKTQ